MATEIKNIHKALDELARDAVYASTEPQRKWADEFGQMIIYAHKDNEALEMGLRSYYFGRKREYNYARIESERTDKIRFTHVDNDMRRITK